MMQSLLRTCKRLSRAKAIRPLLNATGITCAGRKAYNRRVLNAGEHTTAFLGERLRFSVTAEREIIRLDADFNETEYLGRFLESIRPGDVVLDIGGNIGIWTLTACSKYRNADLRCFAFEPDPTNHRQLARNIELNGFDSFAEAVPIAFGEEQGEFDLFLGGEAGAGNHTLSADRAKTGESVRIRAERADEYCRANDLAPDLAKIDVEGFELSVLRGMSGLLEQGRPRELFIEVHSKGAAPVTEAEVMALLEPHGYKVLWRHPRDHEIHLHVGRSSS